METCANTYYLNKYLDEQGKAEDAVAYFASCIKDQLRSIEDLAEYYHKGCKLLGEDLQDELLKLLNSEAEALVDVINATARSHESETSYVFDDEAKSLINEVKGELL